jgi:hypothetical protein
MPWVAVDGATFQYTCAWIAAGLLDRAEDGWASVFAGPQAQMLPLRPYPG